MVVPQVAFMLNMVKKIKKLLKVLVPTRSSGVMTCLARDYVGGV